MFDNENSYTLRTETGEGITRYFVSFADGQAIFRETEVSREVYLAIDDCRRHEKRQRNFFDRYIEHSDLTDETLARRAHTPPLPLEEAVIKKEKSNALRAAIGGLPEVQRRRFALYHEAGLTYGQIAEIEGCKRQPIARSVERAAEKIRKVIKDF
jgi:RNA polymerase sigma-70 factor (ECF subfamily)